MNISKFKSICFNMHSSQFQIVQSRYAKEALQPHPKRRSLNQKEEQRTRSTDTNFTRPGRNHHKTLFIISAANYGLTDHKRGSNTQDTKYVKRVHILTILTMKMKKYQAMPGKCIGQKSVNTFKQGLQTWCCIQRKRRNTG
jgi:hypothetical protein